MISFISQRTGRTVQYHRGDHLGQGIFGSVFELMNEQGNATDFVCKRIDVNPHNGFGFASRKDRLLVTLNELRILKQLDQLEGYSREADVFYIVMPKVQGLSNQAHLDGYRSMTFTALSELHDKNIAHFDTHPNNVLVDNGKVTIIDFSVAKEATYYNCFYDYFLFLNREIQRMGVRNPHCSPNVIDLAAVLPLYMTEMKAYVKEHKLEILKNSMWMGAAMLAATYGIPQLYLTNVMMKKFLLTYAERQLSKELTSWLSPLASLILRGVFNYFPNQALKNVAEVLFDILTLLKSKDLSKLLSKEGIEILYRAALIYMPLEEILNESFQVVEQKILPKDLIKKEADLLFKYSPTLYAKSALTTMKDSIYNAVSSVSTTVGLFYRTKY